MGKFVGGRTTYSQPLWEGTTWLEMQGELNRAVRRKRTSWWLFVNNVPVDPAARVPSATSPFDRIMGELRRLDSPLNYDMLRHRGLLSVPEGPTHTGVFAAPVHQAQTAAPALNARLVASDYDSNSDDMDSGTSNDSAIWQGEHESTEDSSTARDSTCSGSRTPLDCEADSEGESQVIIRSGAEKGHRVTHNSVVEAALQKLLADLGRTPQGLLIEHQCARRILDTDPKATRAIFQSINAAQRAAAFAAALGRAGLVSYSQGMLAAQKQFEEQGDAPVENDDDIQAKTQTEPMPAQEASHDLPPVPARKRGRPPLSGSSGGNGQQMAKPSGDAQDNPVQEQALRDLLNRLDLLERWAHGVDDTLVAQTRATAPETKQKEQHRASEAQSSGTRLQQEQDSSRDEAPDEASGTVPRRVAEIEQSIKDREARPDQNEQQHRRLVEVEDKVSALTKQLDRLRLRPVADALIGEDGDAASELNLNWRLGMIEISIATQASELIDMQKRIGELTKQVQQLAAIPPPPPRPVPTQPAPVVVCGNEGSSNDIAALHQGLSQLASLVHTCWQKQQFQGETNHIMLTQLIQLRQRCDHAAAAWSSPLPSLRS
eukprot:3158568-Amphidinium_carterae.2